MLAALSSGHKVGILVVAGVFIAFALASSFLLPTLSASFPGERVGPFVAVAVLLTAGMLAAIIVLAREPKESRAAGETTTTAPTTAPSPKPPAPSAGDAAAGKQLFTSQGCTACHTFTPAGSAGTVGPNLDHLAADVRKANRGSLEQYATESIEDPGAYVVPGYPDGVMPTTFASLGDKKIADLVAFLAQSG